MKQLFPVHFNREHKMDSSNSRRSLGLIIAENENWSLRMWDVISLNFHNLGELMPFAFERIKSFCQDVQNERPTRNFSRQLEIRNSKEQLYCFTQKCYSNPLEKAFIWDLYSYCEKKSKNKNHILTRLLTTDFTAMWPIESQLYRAICFAIDLRHSYHIWNYSLIFRARSLGISRSSKGLGGVVPLV